MSGAKVMASVSLLLSLLGLFSCSSTRPDTLPSLVATPSLEPGESRSPLVSPTPVATDTSDQPTPSLSTPALTGKLISVSTSRPLANTPVHLAEVFWNEDHTDGAFVLNTAQSPAAATNGDGFFSFNELSPADYVLVVGDTPGDNVIVSNTDGTARVYTVQDDKVTNIGQVAVELPAHGSDGR